MYAFSSCKCDNNGANDQETPNIGDFFFIEFICHLDKQYVCIFLVEHAIVKFCSNQM